MQLLCTHGQAFSQPEIFYNNFIAKITLYALSPNLGSYLTFESTFFKALKPENFSFYYLDANASFDR